MVLGTQGQETVWFPWTLISAATFKGSLEWNSLQPKTFYWSKYSITLFLPPHSQAGIIASHLDVYILKSNHELRLSKSSTGY